MTNHNLVFWVATKITSKNYKTKIKIKNKKRSDFYLIQNFLDLWSMTGTHARTAFRCQVGLSQVGVKSYVFVVLFCFFLDFTNWTVFLGGPHLLFTIYFIPGFLAHLDCWISHDCGPPMNKRFIMIWDSGELLACDSYTLK